MPRRLCASAPCLDRSAIEAESVPLLHSLQSVVAERAAGERTDTHCETLFSAHERPRSVHHVGNAHAQLNESESLGGAGVRTTCRRVGLIAQSRENHLPAYAHNMRGALSVPAPLCVTMKA